MLKLGIYVDAENIRLSGGYGMRYDVLRRRLGGGAHILRANSYVVEDPQRLDAESEYRSKLYSYFESLRRAGFKVIKKQIRHFRDEEGLDCRKANADLDLAVDALVQSENLDWVVLCSGDGDFVRLVTALQNKGIRVEVLGFRNVSRELKETADRFVNGFLVPGLLPVEDGERIRGWSAWYDGDKGYGFFHYYDPAEPGLVEKDVFFHVSQFREPVDEAVLGRGDNVFEFELAPSASRPGEVQAVNISVFQERVLI
ncbi:NYN domain-containing protein [Dissulfurirhabdus thermomarina]|uniref:NYN domain-containing protein n=1 Tax=Dissulfurirhabdus thermomarina TaxID=1765737 RepID=A0A6N9TN21_DISTH|nr:NYN domain-containing protein [Dissulfurirhabdus thermomarina]NDY41840.1 NYN domain-containing protein [Dissulfurirhabdus thermomarina]NMX23840.1 NYN domain-containing protein [Dissulfurirhabdus thermomarina]